MGNQKVVQKALYWTQHAPVCHFKQNVVFAAQQWEARDENGWNALSTLSSRGK